MQGAHTDGTKTKPPGHALTHRTHLPPAYLRIKQPKQLCGDSGTRCLLRPHHLRSTFLFLLLFWDFFFFFSFLVFSFFLPRSPFSFHTLSFLARVRRCCRGTNRLFCKIAQNFKVCLTCTLGRPAVGASVSHTETWGRVLKAPCVSTLLTFKGARSMLSLTWLLWIKYVSSLSQRLPWYTVDHNAASDCRGAAKTKGCTAYKSIKKLFVAFHSAFDTREAPFFFFCPGCHVCVDRF